MFFLFFVPCSEGEQEIGELVAGHLFQQLFKFVGIGHQDHLRFCS